MKHSVRILVADKALADSDKDTSTNIRSGVVACSSLLGVIRICIPIPLGCDPWDTSKPVPDIFNLENLTPLTVNQIVAYDGSHKKYVFYGPRAHSEHAKKNISSRGIFGKVYIEQGTLVGKCTKLHCKYL